MGGIGCGVVGVKMNEWQKDIKRLNVKECEVVREEVRKEMDGMEEDEEGVVYFELMELGDELMVDYVEGCKKGLEGCEYLKGVEGEGKKMGGFVEQYLKFLEGMYEFRMGEFVKGMMLYRGGEKGLEEVGDEVEKGELYQKMWEVFYEMKERDMCMYQVSVGYDRYKGYKRDWIYMVGEINCLSVVGGNYMDLESRDKGLSCFCLGLEKGKGVGNKDIMFREVQNVGMCYEGLNEIRKGVWYFEEGILEGEGMGERLFEGYYELRGIDVNEKELIEGGEFYEKGKEELGLDKDDLLLDMLKVVENLFFKCGNVSEVLGWLEKLESGRGLGQMEEVGLEGGGFYSENGGVDECVKLYEKMIQAEKEIERGDCLYEFVQEVWFRFNLWMRIGYGCFC